MVEKSLVFIKPDGVRKQLIGQVIGRFEQRGIKVKGLRMLTLTSEMADAHYQEHVERPFYPSLKEFISIESLDIYSSDPFLDVPCILYLLER